MKIIELNRFYGDAHPTKLVYVSGEDISTISARYENTGTVITFKGGKDNNLLEVIEDLDYVLAKWRGALRG